MHQRLLSTLPPAAAVAEAKKHVASDPRTLERLDAALRQFVVAWLQNRVGDADVINDALLEAIDLVEGLGDDRWHPRWSCLMDLVRDGARVPSLAADLRSLPEGRRAEIVMQLRDAPATNKELAAALQMKPSHISNVLRDLDGAGLIHRTDSGRSVFASLSARGHQMAERLTALSPALREPSVDTADEGPSIWLHAAYPTVASHQS